MSVRTDDETEYETVGMDASNFDSFREVVLDDGDVIIYDDENDGAWIQSSASLDIESMA